jgi:hypothetical protein
MSGRDAVSGIDRYEVKIGGASPVVVSRKDAEEPYILRDALPGEQRVLVTAYDKAGNRAEQAVTLQIPAIETPVIAYFTDRLSTNESFVVRGTAVPHTSVAFELHGSDGFKLTESTEAGSDGAFALTLPHPLTKGAYTFTLKAVNDLGVESYPTEAKEVVVKNPFGLGIGWIPVIFVVLLILGGMLLLQWRSQRYLTRRHYQLVKRTEKDVRHLFELVRRDTAADLHVLEEAAPGSKRERAAIADLKETLDSAEEETLASFEKISERLREE